MPAAATREMKSPLSPLPAKASSPPEGDEAVSVEASPLVARRSVIRSSPLVDLPCSPVVKSPAVATHPCSHASPFATPSSDARRSEKLVQPIAAHATRRSPVEMKSMHPPVANHVSPIAATSAASSAELLHAKGEAEEEEEGNQDDFDWEAVIDEAAVEGESGSGEKFYDAEDKDQSSPEVNEEIQMTAPRVRLQQKEQETSGVDPSCPTGRIPEAELLKFQAEFERKRANRFHADLEKAKAENARLLALLHQAQSKPQP
ncbi:hypothetical protein Dimus_033602 [Dionaea muscipula]